MKDQEFFGSGPLSFLRHFRALSQTSSGLTQEFRGTIIQVRDSKYTVIDRDNQSSRLNKKTTLSTEIQSLQLKWNEILLYTVSEQTCQLLKICVSDNC